VLSKSDKQSIDKKKITLKLNNRVFYFKVKD
jgi:hypothetical protein